MSESKDKKDPMQDSLDEEYPSIVPDGEQVSTDLPHSELELCRQEAKEYKDKYLRLLAEMDNTRKRMLKEREESTQYAIGEAMADLLPPIDNLEKALSFATQMSEEIKNWAIGFQMILSQFKEVLEQNGVKSLVAEGKPFDPYCHEAVETIETDRYPPGIVLEECVRGYRMGDRVIRPARVKVTKKPNARPQSAMSEPTEENL